MQRLPCCITHNNLHLLVFRLLNQRYLQRIYSKYGCCVFCVLEVEIILLAEDLNTFVATYFYRIPIHIYTYIHTVTVFTILICIIEKKNNKQNIEIHDAYGPMPCYYSSEVCLRFIQQTKRRPFSFHMWKTETEYKVWRSTKDTEFELWSQNNVNISFNSTFGSTASFSTRC